MGGRVAPIIRVPMSQVRDQLWRTQSGLCALCGGPLPADRFSLPHASLWKKRQPTVDHVRPKSKGGGDEIGNLQLVHAVCNRRKGDFWRP